MCVAKSTVLGWAGGDARSVKNSLHMLYHLRTFPKLYSIFFKCFSGTFKDAVRTFSQTLWRVLGILFAAGFYQGLRLTSIDTYIHEYIYAHIHAYIYTCIDLYAVGDAER